MNSEYKTLMANQALMGIFAYNTDLYKSPFEAVANNALFCVDGLKVDRKTPLSKIEDMMCTANQALTFAASQFSVAVVFGAHWTLCLPDCDMRHIALENLPQLLRGDSFFMAPYFVKLRAEKWQELRDLLPSMFDLWRDNEPEDKPKMFRTIQIASAALAGFEVARSEAVELDTFLTHWNAK